MQKVTHEYRTLTGEDDFEELVRLQTIVDYADEPDGSYVGLSIRTDAEVVYLSPEQARELAEGLLVLVKEIEPTKKKTKIKHLTKENV